MEKKKHITDITLLHTTFITDHGSKQSLYLVNTAVCTYVTFIAKLAEPFCCDIC